jgi:release factor glutamine methyltransferase
MEHSTNSKILFRVLVNSITLDESKEEIESIVLMLLYGRKGLSRAEIFAGKEVEYSAHDFADDVHRINKHEPVQYILGTTEFYGRTFHVDSSVLIPRPETELLVTESLTALRQLKGAARVIDIGTGSGCIATTIALELPGTAVTGIDVSDDALGIARENAERLVASVSFVKHDLLGNAPLAGTWNLVVSNPPYVLRNEAHQMKRNVTDFEPHLALFVPDSDPLLFYKAIARAGSAILEPNGLILVEINERLGDETRKLFSSHGFSASITKDLSGKDRIVVARRS